jgi:hypothetical protein
MRRYQDDYVDISRVGESHSFMRPPFNKPERTVHHRNPAAR